MRKAIFLDRDGVIVKNINGEAPMKVSDLELIPEAISLILGMQQKGYKIFIVSNQPDMALGKITNKTRKSLVKKFKTLLEKNNLSVDGIYYCFHHPKGLVKNYTKDCICRKPKPGLLLKAIQDYSIDIANSYMVGDRATDIKAGNKAGLKTILIDTENLEKNYLLEYQVNPDFSMKRLPDILDII